MDAKTLSLMSKEEILQLARHTEDLLEARMAYISSCNNQIDQLQTLIEYMSNTRFCTLQEQMSNNQYRLFVNKMIKNTEIQRSVQIESRYI